MLLRLHAFEGTICDGYGGFLKISQYGNVILNRNVSQLPNMPTMCQLLVYRVVGLYGKILKPYDRKLHNRKSHNRKTARPY